MPRDEALAGDTRAWLEQAAKDLRRAEILLLATPPDVEGALFHSPQAAEKAPPAYDRALRALAGHGQEKPGAVHPGEGGVRVCSFNRTLARSRSKGTRKEWVSRIPADRIGARLCTS